MYKIQQYSYDRAAALGVTIRPSADSTKKIDVYRKNVFQCSIGDIRYSDYATYRVSHGVTYANVRRCLYRKRHDADRHYIGTPGYYSSNILW